MNKIKISPEAKIYDSDGYWLRAACVCVRDQNEREVLLVSSSANPDSWIIPGGKIKINEEPETSATREAIEEAGAVGILGRCLGVFENNERKHRTKVFVLNVENLLDSYDDAGIRKRQWFSLEEAKSLLIKCKPLHCKYLSQLIQTKPSSSSSLET